MVVGHKITVLGACGGIGQPLSLLLKLSKYVKELSLYDIAGTPGVAADLSHINSPIKVASFVGVEQAPEALCGADIVVISAGLPRKPGMNREDLFSVNSCIVVDLMKFIAHSAPKAVVALITNPVNSTLPIAAEVLKKAGVFDPKRLFGVTTLDLIRASTFAAELKNLNAQDVHIPVIGGHSNTTMIPLLSHMCPETSFTQEEICNLTEKIRNAGTVVVEAKAGKGSATLSMAYAGYRFTESVCRALGGEEIIECSFVSSTITECPYFATPVLLGKEGLKENLGLGKLSPYEKTLLDEALPILKEDCKKGIDFVNNPECEKK